MNNTVNSKDIRSNSLSTVRFIAAFQVMFEHMVSHLGIDGLQGMEKTLMLFQGVPIFFGLSGFLIWFSIERAAGFKPYLKRRFFRIYPELWGGVLIGDIVMIGLYNGANVVDILLFTLTQGTVFQFWTPNSLRGYGCGTPNGSLWTICVLIQFYIIAWILYKLMCMITILRFSLMIAATAIISQAIYYVLQMCNNDTLCKLYEQTVVRYLWIFLVGMFLALYFDVVISGMMKYWWIFLIVAAFFKYSGCDVFVHFGIFYTISIMIAIVGFAYRFPKLNIGHDISYAMYIYHMIAVNAFIMVGWMQKVSFLALAILITMFMASGSTWISERIRVKYAC